MLITEHEVLKAEILALQDRFGRDRSALIPMLQDVQRRCGHISDFAMQQIADALGIHPVEVYGVATFYAFLTPVPRGQFMFRLCRTVSCEMAGRDRVARQLENDLGIGFGETTPDGMFTLEWASCLGMCDQGPALLVNERVYAGVTPEAVHGIIRECRGQVSPAAVSPAEEMLP